MGIDLFNGMQNIQQLYRSNLAILASQYQLADIKENISLLVANSYLQILFSKESLGVQKSQLAVTVEELKIANERLLPFVKNLNSNDHIVITGVSCRHQILDFTDRTPLHFAEILASSIKD